MNFYDDGDCEESFIKDKADHPDFNIVAVENVWGVWMVDFITQERKELFGLHKFWWQAEREARKLQGWANADAF